MTQQETYNCDVVVVGTGAAGMAAAITAKHQGLDVLLVEKGATFGGTSARSGGWLWIPCTTLAERWGHTDSPEAVKTYLKHVGGSAYNEERVDAFLENGSKAVEFFSKKTAVQFDMPLTFPDYHAEAPGAVQGGRSMTVPPFDARELGEFMDKLEAPLPELTVFGMMIGSGRDIKHFMRATRSLESAAYATKRLSKHLWQSFRLGRGMTLTNGNALAGRLAKSVRDLNIPMWLSSPVCDLILEKGAVVGAKVMRDGREVTVHASRGVVLAAGGFPHDIARRKARYGHAPTGKEHWSPTPKTNTGDSLNMFEAIGGRVDTHLPHPAAWAPVSLTRREDGSQGVMPHFIDRAKPGVIAVTRHGKRFTNEANSYHDYVQAMIKACTQEEEVASWLICDHRTLRRYGLGCVAPFPLPIGRHLKSGYLHRGRTLEQLASAVGIDGKQLVQTVENFNNQARDGKDSEFGRGSRAYNRYQGDAYRAPNPCVAPIEKGPFYAIKIVPGDLGTYDGIPVDRYSRALGTDKQPIPGLYAVGNDATSIMGGNYPGAGITLGPALTFGYAVGMYLSQTGEEADIRETKKAS